jgi:hypothetical protein
MEDVDCLVGIGIAGYSRSNVLARDVACSSSAVLAHRNDETVICGLKPPLHPCIEFVRVEPPVWLATPARRARMESSIDSSPDRIAKNRNHIDRPCRVPSLRPPPWRTDEPVLPCDRHAALRARPCTPLANPLPLPPCHSCEGCHRHRSTARGADSNAPSSVRSAPSHWWLLA